MEQQISLKDKILDLHKSGNIVCASIEGIRSMELSQFVEQPIEGILYDLNRSEVVVLAFIDDPKWINDFAVCQVIRYLKAKNEELKDHVEDLQAQNKDLIKNKHELLVENSALTYKLETYEKPNECGLFMSSNTGMICDHCGMHYSAHKVITNNFTTN